MGRPAEHGPVVAVDVDGEVLLWCQGQITGPKTLRLEALAAGMTGRPVPLTVHGPVVAAALEPDPALGSHGLVPIAAALIAANPGRARLIEAPESVWAALEPGPDAPTGTLPADSFPETVVA